MKKILAGFRSRRSRPSRRVCGQRGFTLIELAIVMAVVGLVLGASLMPLRALDENRQLRAETSRMETVRDAVLGYALRHRTRERMVAYEGEDILSPGPSGILPGRPYLPCPDVDGDGFEDRVPDANFIQGIEAAPTELVKIQVTVVNERPGAAERIYGGCRASRGTIPWRTLGVPPADGWGNRHTYFADPLFSNAVFGFDAKTIADIYDRRISGCPLRSPVPFPTGLGEATDRQCPAVICLGGGVDLDDPPNGVDPDTEPDEANACTEHLNAAATDPLFRCAWRADRIPALILKAGAIAESAIQDDGIEFPQGGILDGVPFVIVSHGPNGRGAVNHWATLGAPANPTGDLGPVCNRGQFSSTSSGEADLLPPDNYPDDNHEAMNAARLAPGNESARRCPPLRGLANRADATGAELLPSVFVWEPPGGGYAARKFDDLLSWMTREELSLAMGGGIPESPSPVCAGPP